MHVVAFDVEYQPHYNSKCSCPIVFIICILGYKITISVASWIDAAHRIPAHYSQFAFSTRYTERDILGVNDYSHVTIYGNAYMQGASVYLIVPHTHSVLCLVDNTVFENVCKNGSRECQPAIRVTPACCFARHAVSTTLHQFSQRTLCATWSHVQCIRLKFECVALAANRQREIWKNSRGMHANTSKVCWWCELVFCYCNACWCLYAHVRPRHMILECYDDTALDKHWNDDATSHMHRTSSMVHDYTHSWCWWSPSWNDEFNSHSQWAECVMKCLLACECVQAETYIYGHCCYCSRYCDVHSIHILYIHSVCCVLPAMNVFCEKPEKNTPKLATVC